MLKNVIWLLFLLKKERIQIKTHIFADNKIILYEYKR
jgi:hypothetical protein